MSAIATSITLSPRPIPTELYSPLIPTKLLHTFNNLPNPIEYPHYTNKEHHNKWDYFAPEDVWTSGFFPATLYEMNKRRELCQNGNASGTVNWVELGRIASTGLAELPGRNRRGHDVGFLSYPFLEEVEINPSNETAVSIVNAFARDLANLYVSSAGVTRSWDRGNPSVVKVIIDNMMNIDLLFTSAKLTGNQTLSTLAQTHADTTMKNHIRPDGSTWHVVEYDENTGAVLRRRTGQGYSDGSTWARGQTWAIYGFANMFERTSKLVYLDTSRRLASYLLSNIPKDGIIPWDFSAPLVDTKVPGGLRPADSSAAMIGATGLLQLSEMETNAELARKWLDGAIMILNKMTKVAWSARWDSLLSNGTVNWRADNYLTGTVYGDYYFVKLGNELVRLGYATC
ncbi:hypothetical protein PQX77_017677 [Marasmius sp. AFHP31]|nr:hypothetical protein PQX77_017677 [Marasmius sp. AFHP31]